MSEMIRIRSIADYLEEFGNNGVGKGIPVAQVKEQILDAFRKEMFDQICWKTKVANWQDAQQTAENERIVQNIFRQTYKKYLGVINAFNRYAETYNMLKPDDLTLLKDTAEMYDPFDGFDDEDKNDDELFCNAEDPTEEELEAVTTGYVEIKEENEDDGRPEDHIGLDEASDEAHVGAAEEAGTVAERDYGAESGVEGTADAPAGAVYGNSTEEIRPGMRFPEGFWTR